MQMRTVQRPKPTIYLHHLWPKVLDSSSCCSCSLAQYNFQHISYIIYHISYTMVCWASGCPPRLPALAQSTLTSFPKEVLAEIDAKAHLWWLWCKGLQTWEQAEADERSVGSMKRAGRPVVMSRSVTIFCARTRPLTIYSGAPDMLCICRVCLYLLKLKLCEFIRCQRRTQPKRSSRYQVRQRGGRFDVLLLPCNCWCGISCFLRCHFACGKSSHCCDSFCLVLPS